MEKKRVLAAVYSSNLTGAGSDPDSLGKRMGLTPDEAREAFAELVREGLLESVDGSIRLTKRGRKAIRVVFIGGGFEVIHYGHVYTIGKAKELGDVLVVSVARDSTIRKRKSREPLVGEEDRVKLLNALREVDAAILGTEGDIYVTLQRVAPEVVALGYDQHHIEAEIKSEAAKRGLVVDVVRLDSPFPKIKTSRVLKEL